MDGKEVGDNGDEGGHQSDRDSHKKFFWPPDFSDLCLPNDTIEGDSLRGIRGRNICRAISRSEIRKAVKCGDSVLLNFDGAQVEGYYQ